ncbi:MAG: hypothetical protein FWG05_03035 [Kiritimatiellaeota bacterium]|nr:hypothetical protein [Kiritimatiellota bacterium]
MKDSSTAIISDGKSMFYAKSAKGSAPTGGSLGVIPSAADFPDENALQKALNEHIRKAASRSAEGATIAIPTADAIFRTDFLPSTDPEELAAMSLNQAEKDAPLPIEEITQSYEILETADDGTLVVSVCAPTAVIDQLRAGAGLDIAKVERVDALILGIISLLISKKALTGRGREILVAEEGDNATLAIIDFGSPVFIRSLGETAALTASDVAKAARLAMIRGKARRGDGAVINLVLLGAREKMAPLAEAAPMIAPELTARVLSDIMPDGEAGGVAARTLEGKSLNLFPQEWRNKLAETTFKKRFRFGILGAASAWLLLVAYLWFWPDIILTKRAETLTKRVKTREPAENSVNDLRNRVRIIDRYSDRKFSALEVLLEVAYAFPRGGIELTNFNYSGAKSATARNDVSIQGNANATRVAYDFVDALEKSPLFGKVRFTNGPTFNQARQRYQFELAVEFKTDDAGGAAK